ncbi:hypothetical protein ACFLSJ_00135 [Verrucomicrobiota bacterium]
MKSAKAWTGEKGLNIAAKLRAVCRRRLAAACDWAANNQVRHAWPRWDANAGRFPYHVHMPSNDVFLSTVWNTARLAQGLLAAGRALGDARHMDTAGRAVEYVKSLQVFAPERPDVRGAFFEETPQGFSVGVRDGVEGAQAFMVHYFATRDKTSLLRAGAYLDWLAARVAREGAEDVISGWCGYAAPIPLAQYAAATGKKKYIARTAVPVAEAIIRMMGPDGALTSPAKSEHHAPLGNGVIYNDDGLGVALLCTWKATGKRKYLDAASALGEWWLRQESLPDVFSMVPAAMLFLADMARATGDARYTRYLASLCERLFDMQALNDERALVQGGFIGEDRAPCFRVGSKPEEFISIRTTSYALIAMAKLAARGDKEWSPAYSAFGF